MSATRRSWWALYLLGALFTLGALGWISVAVLDLDQAERTARLEQSRQEAIRLSLWRMDSWFGPQLSAEVARLPGEYQAYTPQAEAYTKVLNQIEPGEVLVPSPLLTFESEIIRLHFEVDAAGRWSSPQLPESNCLDLAEATGCVSPGALDLRRVDLVNLEALTNYEGLVQRLGDAEENFGKLFAAQADGRSTPLQVAQVSGAPSYADNAMNVRERGLRAQLTQQAQIPLEGEDSVVYGLNNGILDIDATKAKVTPGDWYSSKSIGVIEDAMGDGERGLSSGYDDGSGPSEQASRRAMSSSPLVPLWIDRPEGDSVLCFARRVRTVGGPVVQGFLADWQHLRAGLLTLVDDILPDADVVPQLAGDPRDDLEGRWLATIPATLVPGEIPIPQDAGWSPAQTTLLFGWLVTLASLSVVGFSLRSSIHYGAQRSRFAGAVTHELRTPLTTFRLYSEMLANGLVPEGSRQEYLETLKSESDRLSALVENVLCYARLEQGRAALQRRSTSLRELLDRALPGIQRRIGEAGMELTLDFPEDLNTRLETDPDAVAQILFNLVDNACKYGRAGGGRVVQLVLRQDSSSVEFIVRDAGEGVPASVRRNIFLAFDRGGLDPANPNPGIGLGLALSRGLARDLGGDLTLETAHSGAGASFCLRLLAGPRIGS